MNLALPINWDTTAEIQYSLVVEAERSPHIPHHVARGAFGFVHPCIQLQIGVKLLGCREYANQEAVRVEANDSERPFICLIQPRLGVGGLYTLHNF